MPLLVSYLASRVDHVMLGGCDHVEDVARSLITHARSDGAGALAGGNVFDVSS